MTMSTHVASGECDQASPLALPKSSKTAIVLAVAAFVCALYAVGFHEARDPWLALGAIVISGFFADFFTAIAHFGFDYVFPDWGVCAHVYLYFSSVVCRPNYAAQSFGRGR
jgi:hypothetical protein